MNKDLIKGIATGGVLTALIIFSITGKAPNTTTTTVGEAIKISPEFAKAQNLGQVKQVCTLVGDPDDIAGYLEYFSTYFRDIGLYPEQIPDPNYIGDGEAPLINNPKTPLEFYQERMTQYFNDNIEAGKNVIKNSAADEAFKDVITPKVEVKI